MNWRLIFSGFESVPWTISVVLAVAVAIVLFVMLRRYEATLVSRGVSRTLFVLRLLVLLVLLLTLLQPVLTKSWDEDKPNRVVIGYDVSRSMDTADSHASPAEMLRWAQALGMLGSAETADLIARWVDAYESGQEPDWGDGDPDLYETRRTHIQGVFAELSEMPRSEVVRRLLLSQPGDLLTKIREEADTEIVVFGAERREADSGEIADILSSDRTDLQPSATDAVGMLGSSIANSDGEELLGVVLFSDGRQTVSADVAAESARLSSLGIPVYTVPIGSSLLPRDLSVASVQVPQTVFLEDSATAEVTFTSSGFTGEEVSVALRAGDRVVDERTVSVTGDTFEVNFDIPSDEVGNFEYNVATDVRPGELRDDNNDRDFTLSVVDNQARVVLVEGDARWEFRFVKSALERDPRVDLSTILFTQPYLQLLNRTFLDAELPAGQELAQLLGNADLLILGDVDPDQLPENFWPAVEKAVAEDSLTLMIVPGRSHMPHNYQSPELTKLLPVTDSRHRLAERFKRSLPDAAPTVFRLQPTPAASDLTLFDLSAGDDPAGVTLAGLPGHTAVVTGEPTPVATVWAHAGIEGVNLDKSEAATVVHQYYGFGQVLWFGVDSTWRWRRRAGDRWHHKFWGQLVRWAARNKAAAGNDQVRMTLSDIIVDEGAAVDVAVRWSSQLLNSLSGARVEVLIETDAPPQNESESAEESPDRSLQLQPIEETPERYAGRIAGLPPGDYRVRLKVSDTVLKLDTVVESTLIVRERVSAELANISCNRDFLNQISVVSGGLLIEPWELSSLPGELRPEDKEISKVQEHTLWDHWLLLLLFFILLTAEWILRKVNGLP